MQHYIGTKAVSALPMTRREYNEYRGWALPADENGEDLGYLVEYMDGGKPNHGKHKGYISWSPKEQFDNAYQSNGNMSFGHALVALEHGQKVARSGWNGKGMWLSLSGGLDGHLVDADKFWSPHNKAHAMAQGGVARVLPSITMKTATGEILMGWLASQTDMLAKDWMVLA